MTSDPSLLIKKIRHLSIALIVSGILNIGVLSLCLYWVLRETPPTPYCEMKPASSEQQYLPLADQRGCAETLAHLSQLSFPDLIKSLSHTQLIENGYAERDLALACLVSLYHFDLQRALPKNTNLHQKRLFAWKPKERSAPVMLAVYPEMSEEQFESIVQFAKTERWPLTAEGLFSVLKDRKQDEVGDEYLVEAFTLTQEFWSVELLFTRMKQRVSKQDLVALLLEGDWPFFKQFAEQQRQLHDPSDARRQKFLLDYLKLGSPVAATLLLKTDWDFAVKKLDDSQVVSILKLTQDNTPEAMLFAKEMLISPRSNSVWRHASEWLYVEAGETMPQEWDYQISLSRFAPDAVVADKPPTPTPPPTPTRAPSPPPVSVSRSSPVVKPSLPSKVSVPVKAATLTKSSSSVEQPSVLKKEIKQQNSHIVPGRESLYVVQDGDSLWKIAN
jgi:hypothetical protein